MLLPGKGEIDRVGMNRFRLAVSMPYQMSVEQMDNFQAGVFVGGQSGQFSAAKLVEQVGHFLGAFIE